jgi:chemotaxis protein histidine kinase CheA
MYDPCKVEEMFLRNLKLDADDVLQPAPASEDIDPVSENVAATMSQPLYVLPHQDHMAHLKTHLAFLKSPLFGQNPVIIRTFLYPMAQHLRDHLLNYYLTEAHEAVDQAQKQHLIEEDADQQVKVILQVQQVIEQQLAAFAQELAQIDQAAQQYKPQPPMPPDSSLQVAQMGLQANQAQLAQKAEADKASLALKAQEQQRKAAADQQDAELKKAELDRKAAADQQALLESQNSEQAQTGRVNIETQARVGMNDADNRTALEIAAAELQTGEKIAVSTGTGVNPGG